MFAMLSLAVLGEITLKDEDWRAVRGRMAMASGRSSMYG
jgi:hypothetical protein